VHFRSLQAQLDTATSSKKLIFHVFGTLAEFERDLIPDRTQEVMKVPEPGADEVGVEDSVLRRCVSCEPLLRTALTRCEASAGR
jgi:hypothetical protein